MHVAFVTRLPECHFFSPPDHLSHVAKIANGKGVIRHQHKPQAWVLTVAKDLPVAM
jgi:hypothetical protein